MPPIAWMASLLLIDMRIKAIPIMIVLGAASLSRSSVRHQSGILISIFLLFLSWSSAALYMSHSSTKIGAYERTIILLPYGYMFWLLFDDVQSRFWTPRHRR